MGVQVNLKDIQSGFLSASTHTANNTLIEQAFDKALDRTATTNNAMEVDLDYGLNRGINLGAPVNANDAARLADVNNALSGVSGASGVVPLVQARQVGDGTTVLFSTPAIKAVPAQSLFVNIDGVTQRPYTDYNTTGVAGQIEFVVAPALGVDIDIVLFEPQLDPNVTNLSAGTVVSYGSVYPRDLAARFSDFVNVKDFGALGDGVSDDYQSIQNAIDYAATLGSATVVFPTPASKYSLSKGLSLKSNISYIAEGNSKVILEQVSSDEPVMASESWWTNSTTSDRNIRLVGLRANGNPSNTKNHGILLRSYFSSIEGCMASSCGGDGLGFTEISEDSTLVSGTLVENKIVSVKAYDCMGRGVINGSTSSAASILTDGFADDIIVRQPPSPTTRAVEFNSTAGWSIGTIHTYVNGGAAPQDAVWFRNPYFTSFNGPFYIERYTRNAVSIINWQRGSSVGSILALSSDATDANATALNVTRLSSESSIRVPCHAVIARGSGNSHACRSDSSANSFHGYFYTTNPVEASGNPVSGGKGYSSNLVNFFSKPLSEEEGLVTFDSVPLVHSSVRKGIGTSVNENFYLGVVPNSNGINGTIKIYGRPSWGSGGTSPDVSYCANFHVSVDSAGVARTFLDEISNTGITGQTISFNNSTGELNLIATQPSASSRTIITVESLNGFNI